MSNRDMLPAGSAYPFESRYLAIDGHRLHYIDHGSGNPVLLLHGNPTWSYMYRNIIPHLDASARCIALDLIGMGLSDKPDIGYTFREHAEYVSRFIERMDLRDLVIVGHDWGMAIGLQYAMRRPDNVRAVAMLEPQALYPCPGLVGVHPRRIAGAVPNAAGSAGALAVHAGQQPVRRRHAAYRHQPDADARRTRAVPGAVPRAGASQAVVGIPEPDPDRRHAGGSRASRRNAQCLVNRHRYAQAAVPCLARLHDSRAAAGLVPDESAQLDLLRNRQGLSPPDGGESPCDRAGAAAMAERDQRRTAAYGRLSRINAVLWYERRSRTKAG
ncbi:alpha/beta fold hydrolase [Paenibacillus glycinis]|uniref:Alpha/beta fold hydrolase n=1 Tax=Paenibacillus glycinis TaxID=2697035 RepID=A0ABW9XLQ4_9BACL|nr:alpha/beta fold hydrolase [Paenibacillus glycinis]